MTERKVLFPLGSYLLLLAGAFVYGYKGYVLLGYLIPLYLLFLPVLRGSKLRFRVSIKDLWYASVLSLLALLPFFILFLVLEGRPLIPGLSTLFFHLIIASIPEEVYFRGYLQEVFGNNYRGVVLVSFMFSLAHSPRFLFSGDYSGPLTFFPSLIMGYLYMKTHNLLYPVVFHLFANLLFVIFI